MTYRPPYTDEPEFSTAPAPQPTFQPLRLSDSAYNIPGAKSFTVADARIVSYAPSLSQNSDELFRVIRRQMKLPLRPLLGIQGTHTESGNDGKKKTTNNVTDFRFHLDLAETMLRGWEGPLDVNWMQTEVVQDGDEQKTFRGGIVQSRQYKPRKSHAKSVSLDDSDAALLESEADVMDGVEEGGAVLSEQEEHLKMWCERFCSDPAPVKSFTMTRELQGFDYKPMRNVLASHIRELNYRGSTNFWFKKGYSSVTIYSPHWINQLRTNSFVWWICVILQLWIITWPIIKLMEKRYEVARSQWNASLDPGSETGLLKCYAQNRDETQLGEFWATAVKQAAWTRRQGEGALLTRNDADRLRGMSNEQILRIQSCESEAERQRRERVHSGQGGLMDSVVGLVRGVSEASQDYRLTMGWGANT
ncbi:hypothetical protein N7448_002027 [Penicillium atrosanguineum]|uniref:Uncharacterized protein n=1 Tax=Penicillium atrosanguineum TaxID=1132637 RepID=A0A9W9HCV0_9EURO|nr:hypothetical protein N7526_006475 [Penicillium atrosanguineum]KAJ5144635.1 hypothetical protein N7448_002027 [Penicillium atrosanguineum]KAJ5311069.1 hypothetical protein N7476_006929 [Penicillium atrosanguineum]